MNGAAPSWLPDWSTFDLSAVMLVIAWESSPKQVQVRRLPITAKVAEQLRQPVRATADFLGEAQAVAYDPDLELDEYEYAVVERSQLDEESSLLAGLEKSPPYEGQRSDLDKPLLLYALSVGTPGSRLVFVRRYNPRRYLKDKLFTLFNNELTSLEEPLLSFDLNEMDLVLVEGHGLAVRHLPTYERLFRDSPELLAKIGSKVAALAGLMPMSDAAQTTLEMVAKRNGRVRARMLAALGRGHLAQLDLDDVREEMIRHDLDPNTYINDDDELEFTEGDAIVVMRVLNEDFSTGGLSGHRFIINKKSQR